MDFLDPKKKRAHRRRLMIGYILVGIALVMGTWILEVISLGYYYDRQTGTVIQNGLIFAKASPVAADIYVNEVKQPSRTDTRLFLPGGQYTIQYKRDGYRSWTHTVALEGGKVERLDYAWLFPTNLQTKDVELYSAIPTFATMSLDRHWLLAQQPGQALNFDVIDLTSDNSASTALSIPANLITGATDPNQSWKTVEWSNDNRHVLLKHHAGSVDEFIMVDRVNPGSSFSINKLFGVTPTQVALRDKKFDQLYVYNAGSAVLQIGDVKAVTLTTLLSRVLAFKPHGASTVLFVSGEAQKAESVSLKLYSNGTTYTLREMRAGGAYLLEMARFDNQWFMVASVANEGRTYIYRDPENTLKQKAATPALLPAIAMITPQPQYLSFSDSAGGIAVQAGKHFAVYDIENDRRHYYDLEIPIAENSQASWMDGSRLAIVSQGKIVVFDFDGTNTQTLAVADPNFQPFFDSSYKWLYTLAPSASVPGKAALTRTELIVK